MQLKGNNIGDTIIEVLLALAVLGVIIGGGYSIATRSLNGVRISQERSEATKLAEGQLEALKATFNDAQDLDDLIENNTNLLDVFSNSSIELPLGTNATWSAMLPITPPNMGFCYDSTGVVERFDRASSGDIQDISPGSYPAQCIYDGRYHVYIDTNFSFALNNGSQQVGQLTYYVNVTWERSGGGGVEHLSLNDRAVFGL